MKNRISLTESQLSKITQEKMNREQFFYKLKNNLVNLFNDRLYNYIVSLYQRLNKNGMAYDVICNMIYSAISKCFDIDTTYYDDFFDEDEDLDSLGIFDDDVYNEIGYYDISKAYNDIVEDYVSLQKNTLSNTISNIVENFDK